MQKKAEYEMNKEILMSMLTKEQYLKNILCTIITTIQTVNGTCKFLPSALELEQAKSTFIVMMSSVDYLSCVERLYNEYYGVETPAHETFIF